jgi:hypothetical protein
MDVAEHQRPLRRARSGRSRLVVAFGAAVPVLTIFCWLCLLYGWEAWGNLAPWLYADEFERAQLSRAVAMTGHEAQRTVPHAFDTLYVYLIAPAWWIHDTTRAYGVVKAIGVATMTSVLFPTYLLARMLVSKPWALFAAAGAAMIPALAYSQMLLLEPLAYPWVALCFYLLAKALVTRRPRWIAGAAAACLLAPLVRNQLGVVVAAAVVAAIVFWFAGQGGRALRRNWTTWDWIGFFVLAVCAVTVVNAFAAHHSGAWHIATDLKGRMLKYGLWAGGALTIGLGVLPTIAGLSALATPRRRMPLSREERAFVSITLSMVAAFGLYTAVKSAYISTLGFLWWNGPGERTLIYIAPLLFVGTALMFERRRPPIPAVIAATGFALYVVTTTPYKMELTLFFDAPGLSILESLNRVVALTPHGAKVLLIVLCLASGGVVALLRLPRNAVASIILAMASAFVLAWNAWGQIAFARTSHSASNLALATLPRPLDWIDRSVPGNADVYYLGQTISDTANVLQLEFWNRTIHHVWSMDDTAPDPRVTPEVVSADGRLDPGEDARYMVAESGISPVGRVLATKVHYGGGAPSTWTLYRLTPPLRLRQTVEGIYPDGWGRPVTAYNQYSIPNNEPSVLTIGVSRGGGGGEVPATVRVKVARLKLAVVPVGDIQQPVRSPVMGKVLFTRTLHVASGLNHVFAFKAPPPPFRVETSVTPFTPYDLNLSNDHRVLGAQIYYSLTPAPSACRPKC